MKMRHQDRSSRAPTVAALLLAAALPRVVGAQDPPPPDPGPPERGVARISIVNGEVSVRRGDSGDWVAAALNAPLMVDDRIATGAGSRAEVQFDAANFIRIGARAEIRLAQLETGHYHLQIAHGTVTFRVLRPSQAQVEIDTPIVSLRPMHQGSYRIYVKEDGQTEATVRLGAAEVFTQQGTEPLQVGQTMLARGTAADPEFRIVQAITRDEWDRWNEQRDHELQRSSSYGHVPQDVYGAEDLDNHGQWVEDPAYGEVWAPAVGPDWAPYQNGRWVWEDYYGWTWVSYDPWGWAPFHYGRWFFGSAGWCWYPGGAGPHYWAPGLVAFFGFGGGFGSVGWVALGPHEPLYAWWGRGVYAGYRNPGYFNHGVNITNVNITNAYRNARVKNAVASVSATDFHQGHFQNITRMGGSQIREAGVVRGQLPVAPSAANLRFSNRSVASVPRSSDNVRFFSRTAAPAVARVPFHEQQRSLQQLSNRPPVVTAGNPGWRGAGAQGGAWRPVNAPPPSRASAWQRFGEPRSSAPVNSPRPRPYAQNTAYRPPPATQPVRSGSQQSVRVAPPVVRERSAPRSDSGSGRPSGGGSSHGGSSPSGGGGGSHSGSGHR